ncbi:MAG: response regulator, partial [Proteobacteria bacterium]|nr:response regulator [Pseudomonadota bacterium]
AAQPIAADAAPAGRGESVLVVDDNPAIRRLVVRQVSALGYRVEQAASAADAVALLDGGTPIDLLFTDVVMPGPLDGQELGRIVAARWPQVAVVMTSGFPGTTVERDGGVLRGIRLLTKPYQREDLARALRAALDAPDD